MSGDIGQLLDIVIPLTTGVIGWVLSSMRSRNQSSLDWIDCETKRLEELKVELVEYWCTATQNREKAAAIIGFTLHEMLGQKGRAERYLGRDHCAAYYWPKLQELYSVGMSDPFPNTSETISEDQRVAIMNVYGDVATAIKEQRDRFARFSLAERLSR